MECTAIVDLSRPTRAERVRGFQPPWRTVYVYKCAACGSERRVRAGSFIGSRPTPSVGAIYCGAHISTLQTRPSGEGRGFHA